MRRRRYPGERCGNDDAPASTPDLSASPGLDSGLTSNAATQEEDGQSLMARLRCNAYKSATVLLLVGFLVDPIGLCAFWMDGAGATPATKGERHDWREDEASQRHPRSAEAVQDEGPGRAEGQKPAGTRERVTISPQAAQGDRSTSLPPRAARPAFERRSRTCPPTKGCAVTVIARSRLGGTLQ